MGFGAGLLAGSAERVMNKKSKANPTSTASSNPAMAERAAIEAPRILKDA